MATGIPIELEQEFNRNKKLKKYLADNQTKVDTYPPLVDRQTVFLDHLQDFEDIMPGKDITTTGVTAPKSATKKEIAKKYSIVCLLTRSYALKYGKDELAANTNFSESKIYKMADGEILPFIIATNARITAAIADPLFTPYGVTAARLNTALTVGTSFNNMIGAAGSIKGTVGAVITDLETANDLIREDINDMDLLMLHFKDGADISFYNGYLNVKVIDDIGIHHAGIEGNCTYGSDYKPAEGVSVTCNQNPKKKDITDVVGHYEILQFKPDSYTFTFTHPTLGTKTKIVKIEKGKMKTVDIHWD